jgi:Fe-S-cluster containining protein
VACAGQCCAVFPVGGLTYAELEERYHRVHDGDTIFDMVRPLAHQEAVARARQFAPDAERDLRDGKPYFRCVRWDEKTRLCTRYDERPDMCSDYPYEWECDHTGCSHVEPRHVRFRWLAVRQGAPMDWWWDTEQRRWVRSRNVAPLTFPG